MNCRFCFPAMAASHALPSGTLLVVEPAVAALGVGTALGAASPYGNHRPANAVVVHGIKIIGRRVLRRGISIWRLQ